MRLKGLKTLLPAAVVAVGAVTGAAAAEKWMTGDWHQHTFFTDGTNFMGDVNMADPANPVTLNGPDVTDPKAVFTAPSYKGVIPQGFRYGLDFQANSEHGGNRGSRDAFGRFWDSSYGANFAADIPLLGTSANYSTACSYLTVDSPTCASGNHRVMWRWQELIAGSTFGSYRSAFDWITTLRGQYPAKEILTGMEWNVPGHEHASTGCLESDGRCIAEFEYRFDQNDTDASGATSAQSIAAGINWAGKIQTSAYTAGSGYPDYSAVLGLKPTHEKALAGLKWANDNHPNTMWVNPAHIERAGCGTASDSGYSLAAIRDMNDTAPSVFFGFEGMPGHQKAGNRGEVSGSSCGGGTWGGAGIYIAEVGGVWDNLLADGRKIYNFVSSDFHMTRDDFYPGEYAKTHVKVKSDHRDYTQQGILDGMRSGNSFAVHGDLISELDFHAVRGSHDRKDEARGENRDHGMNRDRRGKGDDGEEEACGEREHHGACKATMGETLSVEMGDKVTVQIRFKDGAANNNGDRALVDHVQLIQGRINPAKASKFLADGVTPNKDFNFKDLTVASIVATFDADSWHVDDDGYTVMRFTVPNVMNDMFFRVRGTNLGYGVSVTDATGATIYGTDSAGSPLLNTPGTSSAAAAWADLWFYSNPIFVHVQ